MIVVVAILVAFFATIWLMLNVVPTRWQASTMILAIVIIGCLLIVPSVATDAYVRSVVPVVTLYEEELGAEHTQLMKNAVQFIFEDENGYVRLQSMSYNVLYEVPFAISQGICVRVTRQKGTAPRVWWMLPGRASIDELVATIVIK